ncbi:MAG: adenylate/guanylate cyclase domain-containing protein [Pseudomonadota bacterium]
MSENKQDNTALRLVEDDPQPTKKRFRISLMWLLISTFGGLVFVAVSLVLVISVLTNFANTFSLLGQQANGLLDSLEARLEREGRVNRDIIDSISQLYEERDFRLEDESWEPIFKSLLLSAPFTEMIRIYKANGNMIGLVRRPNGNFIRLSGKRPDGDPFFKPNDLQAAPGSLEPEAVVFRDVLFISGKKVLRRDGKPEALLVVSSGRRSLNRIVSQISRENDVAVFLSAGGNQLLAHSRNPAFFRGRPMVSLDEFPDAAMQEFKSARIIPADEFEADERTNAYESGDGSEGHIFLTRTMEPLNGKESVLGVYYPKHEVGDEIRNAMVSAIAGLIALALSVLLAIFLSRRIAKPMAKIAAAAQHFSNFEISNIEPIPPSRVKEIGQQARAINSIRTAMQEFSRYVPEKIVRRLMHSGVDATRWVEREITIMFTDIVGFTSMSEHLNAAETARALNGHFDIVCKAISNHGGTVDKFMGDGVMAFWGAPDADNKHAENAFHAAREIILALKQHNETRRSNGEKELRMRIGIHTGRVIVGNIGGGDRQNYTIVGDSVNVAQRLEQLGKEHIGDAEIVVLSSMDARISSELNEGFVSGGTHQLRGRDRPIAVCEYLPSPAIGEPDANQGNLATNS